LLLQPNTLLPDTILIDEPELGLHPFAINLLAEMLKEAAESKQVIVSTQSVELLNNFQPEDVVVVQREDDASVFKRLDGEELADWLTEDYSLGELWKRNVLGGRPTR
jgi:predicted ATPase